MAVKFVADNLEKMVREESVKILVSMVCGESAGDADTESVLKVFVFVNVDFKQISYLNV